MEPSLGKYIIHEFVQQRSYTLSTEIIVLAVEKANTEDSEYRYAARSIRQEGSCFYLMVSEHDSCKTALIICSEKQEELRFSGMVQDHDLFYLQVAELSWHNTQILHEVFPFTRPVSLKDRRTTFGCGDRLGLASIGHIQAIAQYPDVYPVLAQQSMRELHLTGRTYQDVVTDVSFQVFQEGFTRGYGADGDHLKTLEDIDSALDAHMPMITLDLSDQMHPEAAQWSAEELEKRFHKLSLDAITFVMELFYHRQWDIGGQQYSFSREEIYRCTLIYLDAIDYTRDVEQHIRMRRGDQYDLEISIDETSTPTLPLHHLFIAVALQSAGVAFSSLAPRFIGEFQKGVDYRGNLEDFTIQFDQHAAIAEYFASYKLSIHSGSDKYSVFGIIGARTGMHLHVKTSGTSWLEALRVVATENYPLYRKIHAKALAFFPTASTYYHVSCDLKQIVPIEHLEQKDYAEYLNSDDSRQLVHITYGGILADAGLRAELFRTLYRYADVLNRYECTNIEQHLTSLYGT
jgi:tagaturonate epimerase